MIDELLALPAGELRMASSHVCAQGEDLWQRSLGTIREDIEGH